MASEISEEQFLDVTEKIYKEKAKGNEFFRNSEFDSAIEHYKIAIDLGDTFYKSISEETKKNLKENSYFDKFKSEFKNSYSNLAAVYLKQNKHKEIIEIDKYIITNIDEFFDKSYARIILSFYRLNDHDNAINFYMSMLKKFNRETLIKYDEQLKPVEEKSKELIEKMRKEHHQKNHSATGKPGYLTKIIFFAVVLVIYLFARGYFKGLFGGSPDLTQSNKADLKTDIPNLKSEDEVSVDLDNIKDEDLEIDTAEESYEKEEGIDEKNSL